MKTEFYCFPDESVHVSQLAGKDFCLLKPDLVVIVDTMFGHCRFFRMSEADMTSVFFYSLLNHTARLTHMDLAALAGNAINSWCLQSLTPCKTPKPKYQLNIEVFHPFQVLDTYHYTALTSEIKNQALQY